MKQTAIGLLMPLLATGAFAQPVGRSGSGPAIMGGPGMVAGVGSGSVEISSRTDPPSALMNTYGSSIRSRNGIGGAAFLMRYLYDRNQHVYFGYELLVEQQAASEFLVTFGKLNVSQMEISIEATPRTSSRVVASTGAPATLDWAQWTNRELPILPDPRVVHEGDAISVLLFEDARTGEKLIDDIQLRAAPVTPNVRFAPVPVTPARITTGSATSGMVMRSPAVSGEAREFSAADAVLMLAQPQVSVNGTVEVYPLRTARTAQGPLVWIYLPKRGRYIFSIAPQAGLAFVKNGEVRGGVISFKAGSDAVKVECPNRIATGDAAYHLYVLHDPDWEPTSANQKGMFELGSVSVSELLALAKK